MTDAQCNAEPAFLAEAQPRVLRLLDFLAAHHASKNPPVHDINSYKLFLLRSEDLPAVEAVRLDPSSEAWLTVDFVDLPSRPPVPAALQPVLGSAGAMTPWERPTLAGPDEPADEAVRLVARAEEWVRDEWEPWSARHRAAQATKELYRDLFEQRERLTTDRESVELVWGFRRLRWSPPGQTPIDHPLLTIPVEIEHDAATGVLRVRPAGALEAESGFVADVPLDDRPGFNEIRQAVVDDEALDPWDAPAAASLSRRIVRALHHGGILAGEGEAGRGTAVVDDSWVLYMRRRQPDYQGFLDGMRQLYQNGTQPPDPLAAVVVDAPSLLLGASVEHAVPEVSQTSNAAVEPLLLPLPTNDEQQRILRLAQHRPGVTVQGPPGTGKSHTIANIISHHVAYGRKVLVVAEKEQALRVLADKVPAEIRHLIVSVLGDEEASRRRLESSIVQIQTRTTALDQAAADQEIARMERDLDTANQAIAEVTDRLLSARIIEVRRFPGITGEAQQPTPLQAAEWVNKEAGRLGYIDDEIAADTPPPLTPTELGEYLHRLSSPGLAWAHAAVQAQPELDRLPTGEELSERLRRLHDLRQRLELAAPEISRWDQIDRAPIEHLEAVRVAVQQQRDWLVKIAGSWLDRVRLQLADAALREEWTSFLGQVGHERQQLMELGRLLEAHEVTVPGAPESALATHLRDARSRLAARGKIGRFAGDARRALEQCRVDGRLPASAAEVDLCLHALSQAELRRRLLTRWSNRVARCDGPVIEGPHPELSIGHHLGELGEVLSSVDRWVQLRDSLRALGVNSPAGMAHDHVIRAAELLDIAAARPDERRLAADLDELDGYLSAGASSEAASYIWRRLAQALAARDTDAWEQARQAVVYMAAIGLSARRLVDLRTRLYAAAPRWASRIEADAAAAGNPSDLERAWLWRQLDTWLGSLATGDDPAQLQRRLEQLTTDRRRIVTALVAERAWRRLAGKMGDRERQALNSYIQAVKRYGKTGGKFAARWLNQIRNALDESKHAVPVWVMTTNRALQSFRPEAVPPFDVLIIDEASQIGLEALPLFGLARTTIVVGDDKQTSPENVGLDRQQYFDRLDEYLRDVPKYRTLFDADNSLYDLAFQKFPGVVMLTEHFRCLPQIIEFSNREFYDGRIVPLRDDAPSPGWRQVEAVKVPNGYRQGDVNKPEADAVVELIARLCDDPAYEAMDFGVVSLLGSSQAKLIWDKLYDRLGPDVLEQRRIRCGEPANFQGDERAVVVLSTVVAVNPDVPTARIGAMTGRAAERRINVAASRAENQMWVVHSVDPDRFPQGDPRAALIRHCQDPGRLDADMEDLAARCDSDFERLVVGRILARGYRRVRVQHLVGRYRIDIVVEGPDARLAVECDGDQWHGEDRWHQDRARQEVLERAGWTFERIRGSAFYRDPERALEPLWRRLEELGIPTGDEWLHATPAAPVLAPVSAEPAPLPDPTVAPERVDPVASTRDPPGEAAPRVTVQDGPTPPPLSQLYVEGIIRPYESWPPHPLREVSVASRAEIIDGLVDIVAAEGPMHALRAYQLYVRASGGHRVGREVRRMLNQAVAAALNGRHLAWIRDALDGVIEKTLYVPGTEPVIVRSLGPRQLSDVPRSEVKELTRLLDISGSISEVSRAVLDAYGLTRLTSNAQEYIRECMMYEWTAA